MGPARECKEATEQQEDPVGAEALSQRNKELRNLGINQQTRHTYPPPSPLPCDPTPQFPVTAKPGVGVGGLLDGEELDDLVSEVRPSAVALFPGIL